MLKLAEIAIGISTVLSLIGFIVFGFLYIVKKSSKSLLSRELIDELKKSNVDLQQIEKIPSSKLKLLLNSNYHISKAIIDSGVRSEIKGKNNTYLFVAGCFLVLAIFFGVLYQLNGEGRVTNKFLGTIVDSTTRSAVRKAKILLVDYPHLVAEYSDSLGYFHFDNVPVNEFRIEVSHLEFVGVLKQIKLGEGEQVNEISLERKNFNFKAYGQIQDKAGKAVEGAIVSVPGSGDSGTTSDSNGEFSFIVKRTNSERILMVVNKKGFLEWSESIDPTDIPLKIRLIK